MYFSSVVVFVLVIVINLSGKVTGQSPLNRNYRLPPNNPQDVIVNIGNGSYKNNVAVLEENPSSTGSYQYSRAQPEGLGNRFGANPAYRENQPNPIPQRPVQNYFTHNHQNPQSFNSGGRTQTQGSAFNAKNDGGTSFVSSQGTGLVNTGYGTDNHNLIVTNSRPIQPVVPLNSGGRTQTQTQGSAHNSRNNGGTSFVLPGGTDLVKVGYGKDNHNQIFVNSRAGQRPTLVNGGRRTPQTQSGKASNNGGYGSNDNINTVLVNGQSVQPDQNDGVWSTYNINNQKIHILNKGRAQSENRDTQLGTLHGMLAQIRQIKSQLKQEAETLNIKLW